MPIFGLPCLIGALIMPAASDVLLIDDFEAPGPEWRSKFATHAVQSVHREGEATPALEVPYDFRTGPQYLWVRAMCDPPLDARPYAYLSLRIKGDGRGAHLTAMLMQRKPPEEAGNAFGEVVASAKQHPIILDFDDWRHLSIPLAAFNADDDMLRAVEMVNLSMKPPAGEQEPSSFWLDDVAFVGPEPVGEVLSQHIPYPPADIAIESDQDLLDAMDLTRPELSDIADAARRGDMDAAKQAWARHLETRTVPRWLWSRRDRESITAAYDEHFGGLAKFEGAADRALARDFDWLGVGKTLDRDIEWLQGPTEWTHVLSRFSYWLHLGKAYWGTGDSRYAEDFVYILHDWVADNPVPRILTNSRGERGTVWRTLETGIRGDVWFEVMELFMDAPEFNAEAKWAMTRSLVEHARHLHRYETSFRYGNWQVVECTGLACIGIMLPEFKEAEGWRERAFHYLVEHMERDVHEDGAHHELTPGYHSWVMSLFLRAALLAERNGYEVPGLMARHERMFEFLMKLSRPNRHTPSLGDAGRPGGPNIAGHMGLGALLYDRADMRYLGVSKPMEQWLWLLGEEAVQRYRAMPSEPPAFNSTYLPNALYYTMRTGWEPDDAFLLFDCAPWGGGHSHADRLSICAYAAGHDLIIDPGMYSYDEPLSREYLRFGRAHNVLLIDGAEQPATDPVPLSHSFSQDFDFVSGRLDDQDRSISQTRSVMFVRPDYWVLVDHLRGDGEHGLQQLFHLPLESRVEISGPRALVTLKSGYRFLVEAFGEVDPTPRVIDGWVPTGGATAGKAPVIAIDTNASLPTSLGVLIYPLGEGDASAVEVDLPASEGEALVLRVERPGSTETFAFSAEPGPLRVGDLATEARAVCVRETPEGRDVYIVDGQLTP